MVRRTVFADIERNRTHKTAMVSVWSCVIVEGKASDFRQHERYETLSNGATRSAARAKVKLEKELSA